MENALPFQTPLSAFSMAAPSPRGALLAALFDGARAAALAGDLDAARIAHEAIGKLLGAAAPPGEATERSDAPVVDLAEELRRREREKGADFIADRHRAGTW